MTDDKDKDLSEAKGAAEDASKSDTQLTDSQDNTEVDAQAAAKYGPNSTADTGADDDPLDVPRSSGGASAQPPSNNASGNERDMDAEDTDRQNTEADSSVANTAEKPSAKKAEKKPGRVLAAFAFLFALVGLAGVGYLYYLLVYLDPLQSVRNSNQNLNASYAALEGGLEARLNALEVSNKEALAQVTAAQEERLAANESAVIESLNEAINAAPPSQREWRIAEAEYLLRIANHRVLMEGDSKGGAALLEAADQIIEALDDFALHQVRARLADEIIALRQVPREDLQGLYLRLEALKTQTLELPFDAPAYLEPQQAPDAEQTVWQNMVDELKRFVRVRTLENDETIKPLLAPSEEDYLALNLRLAFEQAQLAVLKRHQAVFELSLQSAREWVEQYMEPESDATRAVLAELDALLKMNLEQELPDVSGSLNELVSIGRSGS